MVRRPCPCRHQRWYGLIARVWDSGARCTSATAKAYGTLYGCLILSTCPPAHAPNRPPPHLPNPPPPTHPRYRCHVDLRGFLPPPDAATVPRVVAAGGPAAAAGAGMSPAEFRRLYDGPGLPVLLQGLQDSWPGAGAGVRAAGGFAGGWGGSLGGGREYGQSVETWVAGGGMGSGRLGRKLCWTRGMACWRCSAGASNRLCPTPTPHPRTAACCRSRLLEPAGAVRGLPRRGLQGHQAARRPGAHDAARLRRLHGTTGGGGGVAGGGGRRKIGACKARPWNLRLGRSWAYAVPPRNRNT